MANIILFDNEVRENLLPLTYTRPVCELRVGILTIKEKWEKWLGPDHQYAYITQDYLAEKYPIDFGQENYVINGSVLPSEQLVTLIKYMDYNQAYLKDDELIVAKLNERQFERLIADEEIEDLKGFDIENTEYLKIDYPWDIFKSNDAALRMDFELLTKGRQSQPISGTNTILGQEQVFLEPDARVECSILNATAGPIYIGSGAEIMEGSIIRGPLAMCEHSVLKMGAKIYGATTIGPWSKVGGEVNNSVIQAYSNKAHDGFLGNSVIGEWCNLGADTNISNLKNNYANVKVWNYPAERFLDSGQQFCGLIMGDHSKCGINTMLNTGTVVGVACNVFGAGYPRNFIPSFSWGAAGSIMTHRTDKAFETAELMMKRRKVDFDVPERIILLRIFEDTARFRPWDKKKEA